MIEHNILNDETELQKVFGNKSNVDNNIKSDSNPDIISNTDSNTNTKSPKSPSEYNLHDFIDVNTWNKIIDFQIKNPEKIKQWQEEDRKSMEYRNKSLFENNYKNIKNNTFLEIPERDKYVEMLICKCLLKDPSNNFVHSVKKHFDTYGRISQKQMEVLNRILRS